jgi:hypothetical protein
VAAEQVVHALGVAAVGDDHIGTVGDEVALLWASDHGGDAITPLQQTAADLATSQASSAGEQRPQNDTKPRKTSV